MKRPPKVRYMLRIQEDQIKAMQKLAEETDQPVAQHLRFAIAQYLSVRGVK